MEDTDRPYGEVVMHIHREPAMICPICKGDLNTVHHVTDDTITIRTTCVDCAYEINAILKVTTFVYTLY